jgi:type IV secretory pathway VirD2 relaxase
MTYSRAKAPGLWKAHGQYLQREGAAGKPNATFTETEAGVNAAVRLDAWQKAGDPRLFRLILSPENGERLDIQSYAKDVMSRVESELGVSLEWLAVAHYNTDHPHVHIAIRGVEKSGEEVKFDRDFVKHGFRRHAEMVATERLGFRTERDRDGVLYKEISQPRVTSLDRRIEKTATVSAKNHESIEIAADPATLFDVKSRDLAQTYAVQRRLHHLEDMGLATLIAPNTWSLAKDYTQTLRAIQIAGDRQKMLARHMDVASAINLPVIAQQWKDLPPMSARVLGHGEEDATGKRYLLLEGLDGRIHYLPHRSETEAMRAKGELRRGEFVTISTHNGHLQISQFGHAESVLKDPLLLARLQHIDTSTEVRPGWLGRFDEAYRSALAQKLSASRQNEIAVRLNDAQAEALVSARFGGYLPKQTEVLRQMQEDGTSLATLRGRVEIRYSPSIRSFYAVLTREDKPELDSRLSAMTRSPGRGARPRRKPVELERE